MEQFRALARPTSLHLDESEVNSFIRECEDRFIIPAITYANFKAAVEGIDSVWDETFDDTFSARLFLDGGEWEDAEDCTGARKLHYCNGLRRALAYFVYAKMLRADGSIVTRAGAMRHRDDNGEHLDGGKLQQYNDVMNIAESYLAECMSYARFHAKDRQVKPIRGSRARIHAIGD